MTDKKGYVVYLCAWGSLMGEPQTAWLAVTIAHTHVSNLVAKARVLSFGSPIRPHSTHPPVGPFRYGRMGRPASATRSVLL